jgi:negative regulator of flagellin synthesis FlgM
MPIEIGTTRGVNLAAARIVRGAIEGSAGTAKVGQTLVRSDALDVGQPPIDAERVAVIRRAIETGNYPIIPARVADAMIAAGLLLRNGK